MRYRLHNLYIYILLSVGDDRLNYLMVSNVETYITRNLDINEVVNKFVSMKMHRYPLKY
jgi:hypothetical protein